MKPTLILAGVPLVVGALTFVHAQTTQPTEVERFAQTAKDFGMTPAQLDRFVRRELGDPIVVDGDLILGVHRGPAGHVTTIQIMTPKRSVTFNRTPDEKNPGLRYSYSEP